MPSSPRPQEEWPEADLEGDTPSDHAPAPEAETSSLPPEPAQTAGPEEHVPAPADVPAQSDALNLPIESPPRPAFDPEPSFTPEPSCEPESSFEPPESVAPPAFEPPAPSDAHAADLAPEPAKTGSMPEPAPPDPAPGPIQTGHAPPGDGEPITLQELAREAGSRAPRTPRRPHLTAGGSRGLPRIAAVLALLAVVVVLVLLGRSLTRSSSSTSTLPPVVKVLIPEGETRLQIDRIATDHGLTGSYRLASRRSSLLDPSKFGAPSSTPDLEGFLFPATYELDKGAPASRLVAEQLEAFKEHFGIAEIARARALHVTPYQLLIVASMVEREAQVAGDRPKIAEVIYNRLKRGMPLGVDATLYYAIELRSGTPTYTKELTEAQLHMGSPYNTRTRTGLPPTPIANPGLASIRAAANPTQGSYLYYVLAPDGCGEHVFARTAAEFEADDAAYKAALSANGGHLPACKKK